MGYTKDCGIFLEEKFLLEIMPGIESQYIKIYIFIKYLSEKNGNATNLNAVSEALSLDIAEVRKGAHYLANIGVVRLGANGIVSCIPFKMQASSFVSERKEYMPGEVGAIVNNDKALSDMLSIAQKILGRLLSYQAIEKLYGLYDWLGMSPDLILRLLEYCADIGKKDIRYIEKVAISWHEMGISTTNDAEEYIKRQNYKRTYRYKIQKLFGIENRSLTQSEQKYIDNWYMHSINDELVSFAYDYTVSKTGKLAIAYINKVLLAWNESGIKTVAQAQESIRRYGEMAEKTNLKKAGANSEKKLDVYGSGRYNYDEIDELARKKLKSRLGKE